MSLQALIPAVLVGALACSACGVTDSPQGTLRTDPDGPGPAGPVYVIYDDDVFRGALYCLDMVTATSGARCSVQPYTGGPMDPDR